MTSITTDSLTPELGYAARAARKLGFAGVVLPADGAMDLSELSGTGRREVMHLIRSADLSLSGLRLTLGRGGLARGDNVERELTRVERALKATRELAAPILCVDLGPLPNPPSADPLPQAPINPQSAGLLLLPTSAEIAKLISGRRPPEPGNPAELESVTETMRHLGTRADTYGVTVAFSSSLGSMAALEWALRAADCPWFGVEFDPMAALADDWTLDRTFDALGPQIRHALLRDGVRGSDGRVRPAVPGSGDVDLPQYFTLLDDAGYHGMITVDVSNLSDRASAARAAVKVLE